MESLITHMRMGRRFSEKRASQASSLAISTMTLTNGLLIYTDFHPRAPPSVQSGDVGHREGMEVAVSGARIAKIDEELLSVVEGRHYKPET